MTNLPRTRLVQAALLATVLAACGGGVEGDGDGRDVGSDGAQVTTSPSNASAPATSTGADEAAPDADVFASVFSTSTPIDADFDGGSVAGRDTVLWFWAPWCAICRAEAPDINETAERFGDDVQLVGIAGRGSIGDMRDFIDDTDTNGLIHVADLDGAVWNAFGIFAQPAFAFIDDDGDIETFVGGLRSDDLADRIGELLAT